MARDGMSNLIRRLRGMAQLGTADYSLVVGDGSTVFWWSDAHVQEALDAYRVNYQFADTQADPEYIGGTTIYKNYYLPNRNWEEANSGSVYWLVTDSLGVDPGTANYTVDYIAGVVRFNGNRGGTAYQITGRAYNLNAAAADVWRQKAAAVSGFYTFKTDNQSFNRSDWFNHCMKMAVFYDEKVGMTTSRLSRSDLLRGGQASGASRRLHDGGIPANEGEDY